MIRLWPVLLLCGCDPGACLDRCLDLYDTRIEACAALWDECVDGRGDWAGLDCDGLVEDCAAVAEIRHGRCTGACAP